MNYDFSQCKLCPRKCNKNRITDKGFCGANDKIKVAKAMLHLWEEPCISGENGSGAIFFSGCQLGCVFCQNSEISHKNFGKEITTQRLAEIFLELQAQGANNINLVSPTPYIPQIIDAFKLVKDSLHIPIVYNTSGYETTDAIKMLDGIVDIYIPDLKYIHSENSKLYSNASNYFEYASSAIKEMVRQVGNPIFDENNILKKGVIIRHLVLPENTEEAIDVLNWIDDNFTSDEVLVSVMSQYTPGFYNGNLDYLKRRLTGEEYDKVIDFAEDIGINGFMQELSSAKEEYTPDFDLTGV